MATLPLTIPLAAVHDLIGRSRWAVVRCLLYLFLYLWCESVGILACFVIWLFSGRWLGIGKTGFVEANYALQRWWARTLYHGALRIFRIEVSVEAPEDVNEGPFILFIRHASLPDVILPSALFIIPHAMRIRHIMKSELLWDPCLDIVGHRVPNCFVRRGSGESTREIEKIQRLMEDLSPRDGVMIYPEGTRFTMQKLQRALQRLKSKNDADLFKRASSFRHVLPPRLGGSLALLEANRGAAAVFCAQVGFESAGKASHLLSGSLIGSTIRVHLWKVPFAEIPTDREKRIGWLYSQWLKVDDWIDAHPPSRD
ncbi:MAG: hypothetical protein GX444_18175 [Myxococcales bacterium]|nr:hypothetical protein [Myxococcales bacterium]